MAREAGSLSRPWGTSKTRQKSASHVHCWQCYTVPDGMQERPCTVPGFSTPEPRKEIQGYSDMLRSGNITREAVSVRKGQRMKVGAIFADTWRIEESHGLLLDYSAREAPFEVTSRKCNATALTGVGAHRGNREARAYLDP